jgi:hypothetical protein
MDCLAIPGHKFGSVSAFHHFRAVTFERGLFSAGPHLASAANAELHPAILTGAAVQGIERGEDLQICFLF